VTGSSARTGFTSSPQEDGAPFSVYGMTALDRSMKSVRPGWFCRITFLGLTPSKKDPTKT